MKEGKHPSVSNGIGLEGADKAHCLSVLSSGSARPDRHGTDEPEDPYALDGAAGRASKAEPEAGILHVPEGLFDGHSHRVQVTNALGALLQRREEEPRLAPRPGVVPATAPSPNPAEPVLGLAASTSSAETHELVDEERLLLSELDRAQCLCAETGTPVQIGWPKNFPGAHEQQPRPTAETDDVVPAAALELLQERNTEARIGDDDDSSARWQDFLELQEEGLSSTK
jgi:hypothetical protein